MNSLKLWYNNTNDTVELYFDNCEEFFNFLSSSIKQDLRTWNNKSKCWVILPEILDVIILYAAQVFDFIDYESLPVSYKFIAENAMCGVRITGDVEVSSFYKTLYLQPDAPEYLVKASYKVLAKKYHPDGDTPDEQMFNKIKDAYEAITTKKP